MKKNKAFTLIELIAVLVILAIISLIVAPLLLNIIRRVKDVANKRSVDGYGRAVEYAMANYQLKHLRYPDSFDELEIEYKGNKVECKTSRINPDYSIYLSECKVNGKLVKDDKEIDGYYHYGILKMTNQEYVDTYGKNLEDALKKYHDEHNEYPSDYTTLELPPSDKEVSCDVSINYDGTVYLNNCRVDNEEVLDENTKDNYYHYGFKEYEVGDLITYNGIDYYVIKNSNDSNYVTMLKHDFLTTDEINQYGVGHVNMNVDRSAPYYKKAYDSNGIGAIQYYSNNTCGTDGSAWIETGCTSDYEQSEIKYVIDGWAQNNVPLVHEVRLITIEELRNNLGYGDSNNVNNNVPTWVYNNQYYYWTMSSYNSSDKKLWCVNSGGRLINDFADRLYYIRPVVILEKSALE